MFMNPPGVTHALGYTLLELLVIRSAPNTALAFGMFAARPETLDSGANGSIVTHRAMSAVGAVRDAFELVKNSMCPSGANALESECVG